MANKKITYDIGFNVDKNSLFEIRSELKSFQDMSLGQLKLIDKNATKADLDAIRHDAQILGDALEKSFNPRLGTVNIETFNNTLKTSGRTIKDLEASFSKLGIQGQTAFRNMTAQLFTTQKAVKQTSNLIDSMAKTLFNTIKWSLASGAINTVTGAIRNAWGYTKSLDKSLNDIRIVTEKSAEDMDKFAVKANKAAKALGSATTSYTKASLIYYQQGLDEEDVQARTDVTIKAANVTGQSAAEVSEQLTAVWNGYKVVAEDAEKYIDKLSAVAASTAADLEELSEGMSKVASGANAMGVDIDQLTAQLSTIVSVTRQDASSVGTALKTIFARMGDLKVDGVDEFGVSLGDVSGTLKRVGIEVLDQEGNLRDMGNVMEEVAGKWGTWTEAQQQAIAVAMAGKRQYNNLLALFENWDMYESALTTSRNSEGTLQKQQDIYMDSLEAKLQQLGTNMERIYKSLFDSESMKDFLDVLSVVLDGVGNFIDGIGGGGTLLLMITSSLGKKWSNEIAIGIGKAAYNMGVLKENTLQNKAETLLMAEYGTVQEDAIKKMVALKKEQLKAEEYLTEEEKEKYNFLIKQTAELYNQKDALEEAKKNADSFFSDQYDAADEEDLSNLTDEQKADKLKTKAELLEKPSDTLGVKDLSKDIIKNQSTVLTATRIGDESKIGSPEEKQAIEDLVAAETKLIEIDATLLTNADKLRDGHLLTAEATEEITKAEKEFLEAKKAGKGIDEARIKLNKTIQSSIEKSKKAYKEQEPVLRNTNKELNRINDVLANNEKLSQSMTKSVNFKAIVKGSTELITSAGQAASAIMSFSNAFKVLGNDSLSTGEKILQFISGIGMSIPMLLSSFKGLASGIAGIAAATNLQNTAWWGNVAAVSAAMAFNKAKTEEDKKAALIQLLLAKGIDMTADEMKEKTFQDLIQIAVNKGLIASNTATTISFGALAASIWATVWPLLIIAAVIAALVLIVVGLVNLFKKVGDNGKKAFEDASKAAESAKERFNEVKQAYDDLKKSIEDYNKAQDAIEELTKGTDEWKEAVAEANQQVIDLLDKYPELAQYISDVDGQLKISEEGQEAVLEAQEGLVNQANRMRMTTSITKAKAENNMLRLEGANNALKTDKYESAAYWASGAATLMGSPLIGAGIGVTLAEEAKERQDAYDTALDVIAQRGNAIIGDKTAFTEAMEAEGIAADLIDALWENKTELAKNSAEIAANNAAIKLQQQQIASSYLNDKSEAFQESENQSQISKIIAMQSNSDSQAYKDELERLKTSDGVDKESEAESIFKEYNTANNVGGTFKEFDEDSQTVTYVDENGDEKQISVDAMAQSLAQEKALEAASKEDNIKKIETMLGTVAEKFGTSIGKNAGKAVANFVAGDVADLSSLTREELNKFDNIAINAEDLSKKTDSEKDVLAQSLGYSSYNALTAAATTLGYKSAEEYLNAMQTAVDNYNYEADRVLVGFDKTVKAAFNTLPEDITKDWSLATSKAVAQSLQDAFVNAGPAATNALKGLYDQLGDISEEDMQAIANAAGDIDWKSSNALIEFKSKVKELGIDLNDTSFDLTTFEKTMADLVNPVYEVIYSLDSLRSRLKEIGDLTKDLKIGAVLSDEDYENLIKYNRALEDYFIVTADGYTYLGGADEEIKKTVASQLDISSIKATFAEAEAIGKELLNNKEFNTEASTNASKRSNLSYLASDQKYKTFLEASGYSISQVSDALGKETETVKIGDGDAQKAYSLAQLSKMKAEDLAAATGITEPEAQKIITDAADQLEANEKLVNDMHNAIISNVDAIEMGTFDNNLESALTSSIKAQAKTYDELKAFRSTVDADTYEKLAKLYLNEEANELGVNEFAWKNIINSKTIDEQEEYLDNLKKIRAYDEIDYYKTYDDAIDDHNKKLELLAEKQELLTGSKTIKNLYAQIDAQKELLAIETERYEEFKKENELRRQSLNDMNNSSLTALGLNSIQYNEDGTVSEVTRKALEAAYLTATGDEQTFLKALIDEIDSFNESIEKENEEHLAAIRETYQKEADLLIEAFNTDLEIHLNFFEAKKEWADFVKNMKSDLQDYEEKTALENIKDFENSDRFNFIYSQLNKSIDSIEKLNLMYETAERKVESIPSLYENAIDGLDFNIGQYLSQLDEYSDQLEIKMEEINDKENEIEKARKEKDEINSEIARLNEEKNNNQEIINDLESALAAGKYYDQEIEKAKAYRESLNSQDIYNEVVATDSQKQLINNSIDLNNNNSSDWERLRTTKLLVNMGLWKIADAEAEVENAKNNIIRDPNSTGTYQNLINMWQPVVDDYYRIMGKEIILGDADLAIKAAEDSRSAAEEQLKNLKTLQSGLDGEISNLNISLMEKADRISALEEQWLVLDQDKENIQSAMKTLVEQKTSAETSIKELEEQRTSYLDSLKQENTFISLDENNMPIVNEAAYQENMSQALETAQGYYEELQEEVQTIYDTYFQAQEEIMNMFDEQIKKLSSMNNILQSQADLMKLIGKNTEGTGAKITSMYSAMRSNSEKNYLLSLAQLEAAQVEYNKIMDLGNEANDAQITMVTNNLQTATENMLSMAAEYSTALANEYGTALTGIIDDYLKEISGMDLNGLTQDWELATQKDERYLDEINSAFAISEIERNFQKSIDETDSYTAQKKLNSALQEQLKILREKDKLSQYDIDRANAMYELTLKQIALEEAQNTANKMKLTRDASGNYSYQYITDQDAIAEAEAELEAAQNELYNMDKERNKELVDEYYSIMQEAQEKMSEAVEEGDTERLAKLQEHYFGTNGLLAGIKAEMGVAQENLESIGKTLGGEDWVSPFKNFTDAIANSDLGQLVQSISNLTTDTSSNMKAAAEDINYLLTNKESPLLIATNSLNDSITTGLGTLSTKLEDSMDASALALGYLTGEDGLLALTNSLGNSLKSLGDEYQKYLAANLEIDAQTNAVSANTIATTQLTQAMLRYLDSLDGIDNNLFGWKFNEKTGNYEQDAGDTE